MTHIAPSTPAFIDPCSAPSSQEDKPHHIVIVGGGAAGLALATRLGDTFGRGPRAVVTLVEPTRTHLWKPLFHEVAAGTVKPSEHEVEHFAHAQRHAYQYRQGTMVGLDRARRLVKLSAPLDQNDREIMPADDVPYDTLVIAIGSVSNDFGTPGASEHAVALDTPAHALGFHRRLANACTRASSHNGGFKPGQLHVAIIGAGATGTELAAGLHRSVRALVAKGLHRLDAERGNP